MLFALTHIPLPHSLMSRLLSLVTKGFGLACCYRWIHRMPGFGLLPPDNFAFAMFCGRLLVYLRLDLPSHPPFTFRHVRQVLCLVLRAPMSFAPRSLSASVTFTFIVSLCSSFVLVLFSSFHSLNFTLLRGYCHGHATGPICSLSYRLPYPFAAALIVRLRFGTYTRALCSYVPRLRNASN